jgi:outer membrane protein
MKPIMALVVAIVLASPCISQEMTATINLQRAVVSTREGQRAATRMQAEWAPELAAIDKGEVALKADRDALEREMKRTHGWWLWRRTGLSRDQRTRREAALQVKAKALQRERDDDRSNVEKERLRVAGEIGRKMTEVLRKYARDHGYSVILDSGAQQGPVLVALNDVTQEIVGLYDQAYPAEP